MSRLRTSIFLIGGVVAVALAAGLSLFFGSTPIPPDQVLGALFSPDMANQEHVAILELRGPRTVGCILVGAAFAVAGAIMQGVTRNPLADSGLLGINAGAAFALALCLALLPGMSFAGVVGCSFVGAAFALAVVFGAVSFRRRNVDPVLLVLAGCAVGLFLTALAQGVAIFFNIGYSLTFWTAGGVAGIRVDTLAMTAPFIVAALAASWALARRVTVLSLGEEAASGLGSEIANKLLAATSKPAAAPALLVLEDGAAFRGTSCGAAGEAFGEICFNTSLEGYLEIVTDPSYAGQIVALTYPQVGNYGVNADDAQAGGRPCAASWCAICAPRPRAGAAW